MSNGPAVPMEWSRFCALLANLDDMLELIVDPQDAWLKQEAVQLVVMTISHAYHCLFSQDPWHPNFYSFLNPIIKSAAPNPDYMYRSSLIDPTGTYRVSGNRGTSLFAQLGVGSGMIGIHDVPGPPLVSLNLDEDVTIAPDGSFSILISPQRPEGYQGDWVPLDARALTIDMREASYDWLTERDGVYMIERLDGPATYRRWPADEVAQRLERLAGFPQRYLKIFLGFVQSLKQNPVNVLVPHDWSGMGGLKHQHYYEGLFEFGEDEALIFETAVPDKVFYWSVLLTDQLFNTIEWEKCQSSLNGYQAELDKDGHFRAVISLKDPGIANWLDPAGRTKGVVQGRWYKATSAPLPTLKRVKFAELRSHLQGTPVISEAQRKERLLTRFRGAQNRRKW
jgi:hypothetical protein